MQYCMQQIVVFAAQEDMLMPLLMYVFIHVTCQEHSIICIKVISKQYNVVFILRLSCRTKSISLISQLPSKY